MRLFAAIIVLSLIAGCGGDPSNDGATADRATNESTMADRPYADSDAETSARMEDGVQVVEVEAGAAGFSPASVHLKAGVPARLVFNRTTEANCLEHVSVPEFGVEKTPLPMHEEAAIEFTPGEEGKFTFVCGMGMQSGTVVVST